LTKRLSRVPLSSALPSPRSGVGNHLLSGLFALIS
jgi:hypothetical protein